MRIFLLTLGFLSLISCYSFSQKNSIGIATGVSFSDMKSKQFGSLSEGYQPGWTADINYRRLIKNRFVVEGAVDFVQKGYQVWQQNPFAKGKQRIKSTYNYLGIAAKAGIRYYKGDKFFGQTTLGLTPSLLLSSAYKINKHETVSVYGDTQKFDLSLNFETSGGYKLTDHSSLLLTLGYNLGIYNVAKSETGSLRNNYFSARLGYNFYF